MADFLILVEDQNAPTGLRPVGKIEGVKVGDAEDSAQRFFIGNADYTVVRLDNAEVFTLEQGVAPINSTKKQ